MSNTTETNTMIQFKSGVDQLLERRDYFIRKIFPKLEENRDYYLIKGRKSLGKAGAEKLAASYAFVATFHRDTETLQSFKNLDGLVVFVCTLMHNENVVGQGRGAADLNNNNGDANKTIKMAQKSAFIDAVIRSTGLSDIFTQDIEDMPVKNVIELPGPNNYFPKNQPAAEDEPITPKQKDLLRSLIVQRISYGDERERWFSEMETASKFDASEMISSFLISASR